MTKTGNTLKDFNGKIIAEEYESEITKGKTTWIYISTKDSELEFLPGVTIISI